MSYVVELMQQLGPVTAKSMFGAHGIFLDGLMFALVAKRILYLKADIQSAHEFDDLGLGAFTYSKKGKEVALAYFQAPEEALEEAEEMLVWANKAYGAALRAAAKKKQSK